MPPSAARAGRPLWPVLAALLALAAAQVLAAAILEASPLHARSGLPPEASAEASPGSSQEILAEASPQATVEASPGASPEAASPETCPAELVLTERIEGTLLGADCLDDCQVYLRLDDGAETVLFAGESVHNHVAAPGARVRLTVERRRYFEASGAGGGTCREFGLATSMAAIDPPAPPPPLPDCPGGPPISEVVEGAFLGAECVDYCRLFVELPDGGQADFVAEGPAGDFRAPAGAPVRLRVERRVVPDPAAGCLSVGTAVSIEAVAPEPVPAAEAPGA